jgi:hypothetical protein
VFGTLIKTHNFFNKFLAHLGVHHTYIIPTCSKAYMRSCINPNKITAYQYLTQTHVFLFVPQVNTIKFTKPLRPDKTSPIVARYQINNIHPIHDHKGIKHKSKDESMPGKKN